ncbi:hypothetical protein FH181_02635 [Staphylococcus warneri]|jgi:hypothetical protein|uniref:hypothetical protein n=2 Tax=Staphylococcus warneri TaxID=1292 RepID=UPI001F5AC817|nr:hypothetical protein [Staphylococcus warneri]MCI2770661.1 hypothetical protein [Staphylococcus warneri]MCI2783380.1 hypothetical protein [Staphylococcus warneri]
MEIKPLYNENYEHLATVKHLDNGLYDITGVNDTQLSHIKRRGSEQNLNTFKQSFELYFENELPHKQTDIFEYLGGMGR